MKKGKTGSKKPARSPRRAAEKTIVRVELPEQNDGRGIRGYLYVDCEDPEAAHEALRGQGLGVMGTELDAVYFRSVKLLTLDDLRKGKIGTL